MQTRLPARCYGAEYRFTTKPTRLGNVAQTFPPSSPDAGSSLPLRCSTTSGRNTRTSAATAVCQKEKAPDHRPFNGIENLQPQSARQLERTRKPNILRGTNKFQRKNYSCPEECGMWSTRRADEVRLSCRPHACPGCVADGAVFALYRRA